VGCDDEGRVESVKVNRKARFGKQAKRSVHPTPYTSYSTQARATQYDRGGSYS
jgi:hypothetical protein